MIQDPNVIMIRNMTGYKLLVGSRGTCLFRKSEAKASHGPNMAYVRNAESSYAWNTERIVKKSEKWVDHKKISIAHTLIISCKLNIITQNYKKPQ